VAPPPTDASLLLTAKELVRQENTGDAFALTTSKIIGRIAHFYGVSNADALAVCGMVANKVLTNGDWDMFKRKKLKVGKIDNPYPNPAGGHRLLGCWHARGCWRCRVRVVLSRA
jgi:hypothetical protein